jgi:vesicle coat complex subunit
VSALGDESEDVRSSACEALGKMGEKAATNEVITRLVSALGDESEDVRWSACDALGNIDKKAATNEVITKLVSMLNTDQNVFGEAEKAIDNILNSSTVITELGPKLISDLCLCGQKLKCLKNISADELIRIFITTENTDWLSVITHVTLLHGVAVSITKQTMTVYEEKEPLEMRIPSLKLAQELTEAFINQAKRLNLCFEMQLEDRNKS